MAKLVPFIFIAAVLLGLSNWLSNDQNMHALDHATLEQQAQDTLAQLHAAEKDGDLDTILSIYTNDGWFLGTDKNEAWSFANMDQGLKDALDKGWPSDLIKREVGVSENGQTAWFRELLWFPPTEYTLRVTGTMTRMDNRWRIMQLYVGTPVPNEVHAAYRQMTQAQEAGDQAEISAIESVLDQLHEAASKADGEAYFNLYAKDSVFIGTDISERWPIEDFKTYAMGRFNTGTGWTYHPKQRWVQLTPGKNTAYFMEVLDSEKYSTSRGTGTMVRIEGAWKVAQYHLTYPMPNDLSVKFTDEIKAFEAKQKNQ